jgi:hypothetical protein
MKNTFFFIGDTSIFIKTAINILKNYYLDNDKNSNRRSKPCENYLKSDELQATKKIKKKLNNF